VERHGLLLELAAVAALALCSGCQARSSQHEQRAAPAASSAGARLGRLLAPQTAGRFACAGEVCSQPYPRLPDSGEWRCADSGGVVWCAGGEPAAGVAPGAPSPGYRCGVRFGAGLAPERVCIDRHPDYPFDQVSGYACSFAQERGMTRVCKRASAPATTPLAPNALPACWLGKDCRSGECDRGSCRCATDQQCEAGRCRLGVCSEAP
jgi:hypothetical protein